MLLDGEHISIREAAVHERNSVKGDVANAVSQEVVRVVPCLGKMNLQRREVHINSTLR